MNICLFSQEYPPDTAWGGIATYTANLARGLAMLGHHVEVITRAVGSDVTRDEAGVRVHRVRPTVIPGVAHALSRFGMGLIAERPLGWAIAAYAKFREIARCVPIDIVEAPEHNGDALIYACRKPKPLVVKLHMPMRFHLALNGHNDRLLRWRAFDGLERRAANRADALSSPSQAMVRWAAANWGIMAERVVIISNPVDDTFFVPPPHGAWVRRGILYVGRLETRKGMGVLVDAFRQLASRLPAVQLTLVGAGTELPLRGRPLSISTYLDAVFPNAEIRRRVVLTGPVPRQRLVRYYQEAAVCVFPPPSFDNFPYTCLEAMACAAPIVASRTGGLQEMIVNGVTGVLVPPNDADALAQAIEQLLVRPNVAARLGTLARQRVERTCSLRSVAERTCDLYERVLRVRRSAGSGRRLFAR